MEINSRGKEYGKNRLTAPDNPAITLFTRKWPVDNEGKGELQLENLFGNIQALLAGSLNFPEFNQVEIKVRSGREVHDTVRPEFIIRLPVLNNQINADNCFSRPTGRLRKPPITKNQGDIQKENNSEKKETSGTDIDGEFIEELNEVMERNYRDLDFNVEQLARKLIVSAATLYRKIRLLFGITPSGFIRSYRLARAVQLLRDNSGSVEDVAFAVGFNSRTYFSRCFKEQYHQSPTAFQSILSRSAYRRN